MVRLCHQHGVQLRQSHMRVGPSCLYRANRSNFFFGGLASPGNLYDGHTLKQSWISCPNQNLLNCIPFRFFARRLGIDGSSDKPVPVSSSCSSVFLIQFIYRWDFLFSTGNEIP